MSGRIVAVFSGGGTGGHLYPALALARALEELRPDVRTVFVGAERGLEARVLPERKLEHLLLRVEGLRRGALLANLPVLRLLLAALAELGEAFHRLRPQLVVVTGGYAGGPAGLLAVLTRTGLVLQEQNSVPGITTRVLSLFAREVHVAFPEAVDALPRRSRRRARVSGNPVQPPVPTDRSSACLRFGLDPEATIALVVGGSQGAEALNEALLDAVAGVEKGSLSRPPGLELLWATGPLHIRRIEEELAALGAPAWVKAVDYIREMPMALSIADFAVSRAGAMATSEFLAWGLPAILVPLPTAAADHQSRNAQVLSDAGAALHLPQQEMSGEVLWGQVDRLARNPTTREAMARAARARGRPEAAREIARALAALLPAPRRISGSSDPSRAEVRP